MPHRPPSPIDGESNRDPIIEALLLFFAEDDIKRLFRDFYRDYGGSFSKEEGKDDDYDQERSHRAFEAFSVYEDLLAAQMEEFMAKEDIKEEALIEALHVCLKGGKEEEVRCDDDSMELINNLLAGLDFNVFASRMEREERINKMAIEDAEMLGF